MLTNLTLSIKNFDKVNSWDRSTLDSDFLVTWYLKDDVKGMRPLNNNTNLNAILIHFVSDSNSNIFIWHTK